MKKYDTYKDSGNQWIGQIPEHWKMLKLRWICNQIFTGKTPEYSTEPNGLLVFGQRNNQKSGIDFTGIKYADEAFFASRSESEFLLFGDVLLNTLGGGSVGRIGFYDKTDQQVITDGHVMILRTNDICTQRYLYYSLWAQQTKLEEAAVGSTNQAFLTTTQMTQWRIALPPLSEQQAIVEFLDKKTGQIDQSIALLETQKTDLQAYRQALITETVTKGLNPNAPMKDTGIQWIGEIPEGWEITSLKHVTTKIGSGVTPKGGANVYTDNGILFIRSQNVYAGGLKLDDVAYISKDIDDRMPNSRVQYGDVLLNITGASIGRCATFDFQSISANVNQHVCIIRPVLEHALSKFLQYVLNSNIGQQQIALRQTGGNREGLNFEQLRNFTIPKISLSEQQAIVSYLDKKTSDIDAALKLINTQIADLQAYRTALISEAVMGKIDVR